MSTTLNHVENQNKRKNILIEGMTDEKGENWNDLELKFHNLFHSHLGLETKRIDIECVQRRSKPQTSDDESPSPER